MSAPEGYSTIPRYEGAGVLHHMDDTYQRLVICSKPQDTRCILYNTENLVIGGIAHKSRLVGGLEIN